MFVIYWKHNMLYWCNKANETNKAVNLEQFEVALNVQGTTLPKIFSRSACKGVCNDNANDIILVFRNARNM